MHQLCFYVPESHLESVKEAVFATGAGRIGDYEACCWQTKGQGQYRPLAGANPYRGERGKLEQVAEYKVELVCSDALVSAAIAALKQAHPYEEPACQAWRVADI